MIVMDQVCCCDGGGGVGEFVAEVVLWRRADVSACVLGATVSAWLLLGSGGGGYTVVSLASNVLLLLLSVLFVWAKAARLLNRPAPPIPELRVSQQAVNQVASLLHSGLNTLASAFRDIALGTAHSLRVCRVFLSLAALSLLGTLTDFQTLCYAGIVAALTIPALYERYQECVDRYMRLAYINLQMYEMVYQTFSLKCFLAARDSVIELLKDP